MKVPTTKQITSQLRKALEQAGTLDDLETRLELLHRLYADVEEMRLRVEHEIGKVWPLLDESKPYQHGVESIGKKVAREKYGLGHTYYFASKYFGGLTLEELEAVVTWVRSEYRQTPPTIRTIVDELRKLKKKERA